MLDQLLYKAIFRRKSIRKYDLNPLPAHELAAIEPFAASIRPPHGHIRHEICRLDAGRVLSLFPIKAPHYLCLYSERKDGYLLNAGYVLQHVDLYLSAHGYGGCWLGAAKPMAAAPSQWNGLSYVVMLAFGRPAEQLHRIDVSQFRRYSLAEITDIVGADELLEPVRLAPSGLNSQPWFISGSRDDLVLSRKVLGPMKAVVYDRLDQINMGIALCHLRLALQHAGQSFTLDFRPVPVPPGYQFVVRVRGLQSRTMT
jgi:nitroreductase